MMEEYTHSFSRVTGNLPECFGQTYVYNQLLPRVAGNRGDAKNPVHTSACQHRVIDFEKDEDKILPG